MATRRRRWLAISAAVVVLSADLTDSATARTIYFHPRSIWLLAGGAAAAAGVLVLAPRVPSFTVSLGAGTAAGGALGTFVAALVWSQGVPDPLVRGSVAFNVADVAITAGVTLLLASTLFVGWRSRHQLRQPV